MSVTYISHSAEYGKAHQDFFCEYPTASTMVEIKTLVYPEMLIEVEVDAIFSK